MEKYQEQAWDCLTEKEQASLMFTSGKGLSTWETGEILKMSHYKYLELKARSEKFFRLFSDYFQKYPSLISPNSPVDERFRDFIFGAIIKRLPLSEAKIHSGDSSWVVFSIRKEKIINNMESLLLSSNPWDRDLRALILEFDRWNNFRILPRILQAPSAYKRRSTKKSKVYIEYLHRIPEFKMRQIIDTYWRKGKPHKRYYVAVVSEELFPVTGYGIMPIKRVDKVVEAISRLKLYIFENEVLADTFGFMVMQYFDKTVNSKSGLKYWGDYRELIQKAINASSIDNSDFTCETLDNAYNLRRKASRK